MALRCVIVDDSADVLRAVGAALARGGMTVVGTARTADEAVRAVAEARPDVTLVDIDLGSDSGFELVSRLARELGSAAGPTILISTYAQAEYAELVAASPAVGFLGKSDLSVKAIARVLDDGGATGLRDT